MVQLELAALNKYLVGHYVAYRKLVSPRPSDLLPEERFRLYAVCARSPHNLSQQVPWQGRQAGVYDCQWGTDVLRVIVAGQLAREAHNAPLHLFSASPELVDFAKEAYQQRSGDTSGLLGQLFERFEGEGFAVSYTMEDFRRDYAKEHFPRLTPQEQREVLQRLPAERRREILESLPPEERRVILESLPLEERLAGLSDEAIRQYLEQRAARRPTQPRKPRRKK
jgi:hypothetical protein